MDEAVQITIFLLSVIYIVLLVSVLVFVEDYSFFNLLRNYKKWIKINFLGVLILTLFINIILFPFAIIYWFIKLVIFIFKRR